MLLVIIKVTEFHTKTIFIHRLPVIFQCPSIKLESFCKQCPDTLAGPKYWLQSLLEDWKKNKQILQPVWLYSMLIITEEFLPLILGAISLFYSKLWQSCTWERQLETLYIDKSLYLYIKFIYRENFVCCCYWNFAFFFFFE